ncbi:19444_t:CDS:2, partial [Gigaspora margarita]
MNNRKYLVWHLVVIFLAIVVVNCSEANEIKFDLTRYGNLITARQYEDGKLLIVTSRQDDPELLYLIYQNGSVVSISYEDSINFKNSSTWIIENRYPLATNYVILIYYSQYDKKDDITMHGTIINLEGKITTDNFILFDHFNRSNYDKYSITEYNDISKSFIITYNKFNDLKWMKYAFSKINGIATPVSNGFIKLPRDGYNLSSYKTFAAISGQHAIVYSITNYTYHISSKDDYRYPNFAVYAHFIKDGLDQQSEQFLLYETYNRSLSLPSLTNCQAGFTSFKFQSNICVLEYYSIITLKNISHITDFTKFIKFSSSGSVIQIDIISKPDFVFNNSFPINNQSAIPLPYGGSIIFNTSSTYDLLEDNLYRILQIYSNLDTLSNSHQIFEAYHDYLESYGVFDNNTLWFVYGNNSYDRKLITIDVERVYADFGYENPAILSSYPELNMEIPLLFNDNINISLVFSIFPSSGNISVYQMVDQNTFLLRQIYPVFSHCLVYDTKTLSCQILSSTFNRINSNYTIVVDDNFVTSLFNEPLRGIKKGVWNVMTSKSYNSVISDSTEALLRLNSDGSSYFSSYNQSQLLDDLLQQIKESIPLMNDQLKITHSVQSDPSDVSKLLIEFSISKATDPLNEPSVNSIVKDLDIMIKNKYISALSDKKFMIFLDDQYGFQVKPNLWAEIRYKLLALVTVAFVLFVIYFWAQWYYPKHNAKFLDWFINNVKSVSIFTIIASTDVSALNILSSNFAGFTFFSAPISKKAENLITYGVIIDILIEDIPQLIIQ